MPARPVPTEDAAASLLGRAVRPVDWAGARRAIQGRAVLITGAGGSIGGALARTIGRLGPARLALLDHAEYPLWRTGQELTETNPDAGHTAIIADIRDRQRLGSVLAAVRPDIVFHAAALKHVPIVEAHPLEGLLTNAVGTRHLLDTARAAGVRRVVLVSTDKAVAPVSVMGTSKRLSEMYGQAMDVAATRGGAFRCVSLRFGNVLDSAGAVAQLFHRQLARGGPLTVTHPDMRRYFITATEAIGLLLSAAEMTTAGTPPPGAILVPEMGAPVRILDLARRMAYAAGNPDVGIQITSPRPGERLAEHVRLPTDPIHPLPCPGLVAITPHVADLPLLGRAFDELEAACRDGQASGQAELALTLVSRLIPGLDHCAEGRANRLRA